jgi:hypothetical protein
MLGTAAPSCSFVKFSELYQSNCICLPGDLLPKFEAEDMKVRRDQRKTDTSHILDDNNIFLGNTIVLCQVETVKWAVQCDLGGGSK